MSTRRTLLSASTPVRSTTQIFALPGLLPERTRVFLNIRSRTASLLHLDGEEPASQLYACQLAPSAASVFLALLQAYPQYCPHQTLLAALYPDSPSQGTAGLGWEQHVRPIRRALQTLAPALQTFGLQVVALRRRGYLLAPAMPSIRKPDIRQAGS